jgi:hypothetical protein
MPTKPGDATSMGEKGKHMPPGPRLVVGPYTFLPLVDDEWQPVQDKWVLPGCQVLTTSEVTTLADARGVEISIVNFEGERA